MSRRALVATLICVAAIAAPAAAVAQDGTQPLPTIRQDGPPPSPGPSLQVVSAQLGAAGTRLRFAIRFNRAVAVDEFDSAHERVLCIVLSPTKPSRRRVCIGNRDGRPSATLAPIDLNGGPIATPRLVHRATIRVQGDVLLVSAAARALKARPGRELTWRVVVNWRDGGPCEIEPDPLACVQVVPAQGELRLEDAGAPQPPPPEPSQPSQRRGHLRLLATGDSMIQLVDDYLKSGLARRRATAVRSDAHVGSGISKLALFDWIRTARGQATGFKPDVTVMFIGANDGFPMKTRAGSSVACCDAGWTAEYARRVAAMMRSYGCGARSLVYWLTLPAPRGGNFVRVFHAVNTAIRRAAAQVGDGARVIDLVPVFTPGGRFRQSVTYHGRTVSARQPDGVHLSLAGAQIAASLVIDRLRADHALPVVEHVPTVAAAGDADEPRLLVLGDRIQAPHATRKARRSAR